MLFEKTIFFYSLAVSKYTAIIKYVSLYTVYVIGIDVWTRMQKDAQGIIKVEWTA